MYDLLIQDATILRAGERTVADIAVEDGKIAYVGANPAGGARRTLPAIGRFVMPGAVDGLARLGPAAGWRGLARAALAGGVTTLVVSAGEGDPAALRALRAGVAEGSPLAVGLWGEARPGNAAALADLAAEGAICGSLADLSRLGAADLAAHLDSGARVGALLGELDALKAAIQLLRERRTPLHLIGVSAAAEVALLEPLRATLPLTTAASPDHLFLSVEALERQGLALSARPPIRPELDRRALWAAVKRGRIDCAVSAHDPGPDGLPGVEALLRLLLSGVRGGRISLEQAVALCAEAPARALGLPQKGRITVGADADLVLFREGEVAPLPAEAAQSRVGWAPYLGRELPVAPLLVLVGGQVAAREGRVVEGGASAQPLAFSA